MAKFTQGELSSDLAAATKGIEKNLARHELQCIGEDRGTDPISGVEMVE